MPIYAYRCEACGAEIEKRQSFQDDPLTICETCGGRLRRVLHPVGIVFKGSGFYNTDSRKSSSVTAASNGEASKSSSDGEPSKSSSGGESSKGSSESAPATPSSSGASSSSGTKSSEPSKSGS